MPPSLPPWISILFVVTTLATLFLFYGVLRQHKTNSKRANVITIGLIVWLALQAGLALGGFYYSTPSAIPPRPFLMAIPPLLLIAVLFFTAKGRAFVDGIPLLETTYLNVVRIPVEITLLYLFVHGAIPEVMTFEGRNFDILAGLTAPFVAYYGIQKDSLKRGFLLIWNSISLALLLTIVALAILALPTAFQQLAFDQPNNAVLFWPFNWLPSFVVPVVLFGHLASIRQLRPGWAVAD